VHSWREVTGWGLGDLWKCPFSRIFQAKKTTESFALLVVS